MMKSKFFRSLLGPEPKYSSKAQQRCKFIFISLFLSNLTIINPLFAQTEENLANSPKFYQVIVNSNLDGEIIPDDNLTLREAIEIINNSLPVSELSENEKKQVQILENTEQSKIQFNLKQPETTIKVIRILPLIQYPVIIDGTTNEGYDIKKSPFAEKEIPIPVVGITPAENKEIFRGLTLVSDKITIRGLSIYGFNITTETTLSTYTGDIVIAHKLTPQELREINNNFQPENIDTNNPVYMDPLKTTYDSHKDKSTSHIIIENNFLGLPPNQDLSVPQSNFGITIINSSNTLINNNYITHHQGSGILTNIRAENVVISNNIITDNGTQGVPDAIRLEGNITNSQIKDNLICANDGSSIYLYRPQGNVTIANNNIKFNGKRISSPSIFLTGNNHQIINNNISYQIGPGILVAAYPESTKNIINNNQFNNLEGLSIDLNSRLNVGLNEARIGNGVNPLRNSENRRKETGNSAINAPQFISHEFFEINHRVGIDGIADPNSLVTIYQVTELAGNYGPLNKILIEVTADEKGRFTADLNLKAGDLISAIATLPEYGTSEPAQNAMIIDFDRRVKPQETFVAEIPVCTTKPEPKPRELIVETVPPLIPEPQPEPELTPELELQSITLKVPRNVHFALDKSNISPQSAQVLDKIAQVLRENPYIIVDLLGHTDSRGNVDYNLALANRRAIAVRDYLLKKGIDGARMTIRSLGKSQLKKPGDSIMDHAYNRRVEVMFRDIRGIELIIEEQYEDLQLEK